MAVNYTWTIAQCEHEVSTGGITVAHWRVMAADGDFTASAYGSVGFTPNPASPNFKPYNQVSQVDVLGWVWSSVDKANVEASLSTNLKAQKNPPVAAGVPWA